MATNNKGIDESQALEEALEPIVNKLIDKNFENSQEKLATQIAPLIGVAIKEQIRSQKDDIIDALYPVMGNMISKFVTKSLEEMLHKINAQIQNGLSTKTIKRKIKAKMKGVSETELLLQENSSAQIQSVLLIHKESGILLAKVEKSSHGLNDPDMLASMMTAIRSFVNDWIANDGNYQELGEIEYGGNKIIIEASGSSYLAIIVEGAAYAKTYETISEVFATLVSRYGDAIQAFDGDIQNIPLDEIKELLQTLLLEETQLQEEKKKIHPLLILLPILLILWFLYNLYTNYLDTQLQDEVNNKLSHTPQLLLYKIDTKVKDKELTLSGNLPYEYYKNLTEKTLQNIEGLESIKNEINVVPIQSDPMQISAHIAYYIKGLQIDKDIHLSYTFDFTTLKIEGSVANKELKKEILAELDKIQGIQKIEDKIKVVPLKIEKFIYFQKNSSRLDLTSQNKLITIINKLHNTKNTDTLVLNAYSDKIGSIEHNRYLAKKRVKQVEKFLKEHGGITNPIKSEIFDSYFPGMDETHPNKSRCIHISLQQSQI